MISRIVRAVVVGVVTTLACIIIGSILLMLKVDLAQVVGGFLKTYAGAFGILAALWYGFSGSTWPAK